MDQTSGEYRSMSSFQASWSPPAARPTRRITDGSSRMRVLPATATPALPFLVGAGAAPSDTSAALSGGDADGDADAGARRDSCACHRALTHDVVVFACTAIAHAAGRDGQPLGLQS